VQQGLQRVGTSQARRFMGFNEYFVKHAWTLAMPWHQSGGMNPLQLKVLKY
jgi:hypothetical protein